MKKNRGLTLKKVFTEMVMVAIIATFSLLFLNGDKSISMTDIISFGTRSISMIDNKISSIILRDDKNETIIDIQDENIDTNTEISIPKTNVETPKTNTTTKSTETPKTNTTTKSTETSKTNTTTKSTETPKTNTTTKSTETSKTDTTTKNTETPKTNTTTKSTETSKTDTIIKNTETPKTNTKVISNGVIEDTDLYLQHNEDGSKRYELIKSESGTTTIYKEIFPTFTSSKAWTTDGKYIDHTGSAAHGATSPNNYISVKEGETYYTKTYGVGNTDGKKYAPFLFLDKNNKVVDTALFNTHSKSKGGVTFVVPKGAVKMHITMYNNQGFTLQKVMNVTNQEFDAIVGIETRSNIESKINSLYSEYTNNETLYYNIDKSYITFVNDDTRPNIASYVDLFASKKLPLCLATIPELLIENSAVTKETRLEVVRRLIANGGEVLSHSGTVITENNYSNYETMYNVFIRNKKLFEYYGIDVNGVILGGGSGQIQNTSKTAKWATSLYDYSDRYGTYYNDAIKTAISTYYYNRTSLAGYKNNLDELKATVDKAIASKKWIIFLFHSYSEIDEGILSQLLDYINSKQKSEVEVVTYKKMYDNFAVKEQVLANSPKTYYISSNGTSNDGTSASNPMSLETALSKNYFSGDTILFKAGDSFFGQVNFNIYAVNNRITTVSSYGSGAKPNIYGYKEVNNANAWESYGNGIYRVDLTNINNFSGVDSTSAESTNIGFYETNSGVKYYKKKASTAELTEENDFYTDGQYFYMKSSSNPYNRLGTLKMATRVKLFIVSSNMVVNGLRIAYTGAHGIVDKGDVSNLTIKNCIIENIGGSYLKGITRYGNGIEFYESNVSNIVIENNILRNIYDVGFTIQGTKGGGTNVFVRNNVFVQNSQDSEVWGNNAFTGIVNYQFYNNISINQGRCWGYEARPDQYPAAHILFWGYNVVNTDIYFHDNTVYNPRRIYYFAQAADTYLFIKNNEYVRSDYNKYYLAKDAKIYRYDYKYNQSEKFVADFNKDVHSTFTTIEVNDNITKTAANSNNIDIIRKLITS